MRGIAQHFTTTVTQLLDLTNFAETWRHTSLPDLVIHTQRIRGVSRNALYKSTFTYLLTSHHQPIQTQVKVMSILHVPIKTSAQ